MTDDERKLINDSMAIIKRSGLLFFSVIASRWHDVAILNQTDGRKTIRHLFSNRHGEKHTQIYRHTQRGRQTHTHTDIQNQTDSHIDGREKFHYNTPTHPHARWKKYMNWRGKR